VRAIRLNNSCETPELLPDSVAPSGYVPSRMVTDEARYDSAGTLPANRAFVIHFRM